MSIIAILVSCSGTNSARSLKCEVDLASVVAADEIDLQTTSDRIRLDVGVSVEATWQRPDAGPGRLDFVGWNTSTSEAGEGEVVIGPGRVVIDPDTIAPGVAVLDILEEVDGAEASLRCVTQ